MILIPYINIGTFKILHPFVGLDHIIYSHPDGVVNFDVYTTKGTLQMAGNKSEAVFDFASKQIFTTNISIHTTYDGGISCDHFKSTLYTACLHKDDLFFTFDPYNAANNPPYLNMHTVLSIYTNYFKAADGPVYYTGETATERSMLANYKRNVINTDVATNWAQDSSGRATFHIYKFWPSANSTYEYVAECSNR